MRIPPLLLGGALLFWGWETDFLAVGAILALISEGARATRLRWDFSDEELHRIWLFCSLALLAVVAFALTTNEVPASLGSLAQNPALSKARENASSATQQAALSVFRWLPMVFFLFVAAQTYGTREKIPWATISLWGWRQRLKAKKAGRPAPREGTFNVGYPYFALCLLAASFYDGDRREHYFWGFAVLALGALWSFRSRRVPAVGWLVIILAAGSISYGGQRGMLGLQNLITRYNAVWMENWLSRRGADPTKSRTSLGQIGRMGGSGKIVLRLETRDGESPPSLLREASYSLYRETRYRLAPSAVWDAGAVNERFEELPVQTNGTSWELIPDKTNTESVQIACYLNGGRGVLPLPSGSGWLDNLDVFPLGKNGAGTVLAAGGPGLVIFNARYGPGATIDSPATNLDLYVPDRETNALNQFITEAGLAGLPHNATLMRLRSYIEKNFTYSIWLRPQPLEGTNDTLITRFLLRSRTGHCEYFASSTVLLLRQLHIPARYATGYVVHETHGNKHIVRERDGHAWCLVWNDNRKIWEDFDTTPAARTAVEDGRASPFQSVSDAWSRLWFEFSKFRWGKGQWRQYLLWVLMPVLVYMLYRIIRQARRGGKKNGARGAATEWPGRDSEFYQLERRLAEIIGPRAASEPLSDWLKRATTDPALTDTRSSLTEILNLHYRHRFDPQGLAAEDRVKLKQAVQACLQKLTNVANAR